MLQDDESWAETLGTIKAACHCVGIWSKSAASEQKAIGDVLRTCQATLLAQLQDLGDYVEIVLGFPRQLWPRAVRGHEKWRHTIDRDTDSFSNAAKNKLCRVQELPISQCSMLYELC